MPETRYTDTYENGVLVSHEPYEVSDAQLAEEAAMAKEAELHNHLSTGYYVVLCKPPVNGKRVVNTFVNVNGKLEIQYET